MKNKLTLTVLAILLSNSHSNIYSVNPNLDENKILTTALLNQEEPFLNTEQLKEEQLKIKNELFGKAINVYEQIFDKTKYENLVRDFYQHNENFLIKEFVYLKTIHENISLAFETRNYKEACCIYLTTLNPNFDPKTEINPNLTTLFGKDIFHKKHAYKVKNELVDKAIKKELENIDDYFLLAVTLIESLHWTEWCIKFFENLKTYNKI